MVYLLCLHTLFPSLDRSWWNCLLNKHVICFINCGCYRTYCCDDCMSWLDHETGIRWRLFDKFSLGFGRRFSLTLYWLPRLLVNSLSIKTERHPALQLGLPLLRISENIMLIFWPWLLLVQHRNSLSWTFSLPLRLNSSLLGERNASASELLYVLIERLTCIK